MNNTVIMTIAHSAVFTDQKDVPTHPLRTWLYGSGTKGAKASAISIKVMVMDTVAYRYFCYYMNSLLSGDQFTAIEVMDYIKARVKNHTPSKRDVGRMVVKYGQIRTVGYEDSAIYQVV